MSPAASPRGVPGLPRKVSAAARRRRAALVLAVAAALAVGLWLALSPGGGHRARSGATTPSAHDAGTLPAVARAPALSRLHGAPVTVAIDTSAARPPVPRDFLGLSFELGDVPRLARYAARGNLTNLLRSIGPGVLRLGGVTADTQTAWSAGGPRPAWAANVVTAAELQGIALISRETGWPVLLTVNVGHPDAASAAAEVAAARAALGGRLAAVELGNEPDAYVVKHLRSAPWDFARYRSQIAPYKTAIAAAAPGVPIAGPDASSGIPPLSWVSAEAANEHPALLTSHFYPSTSCGYHPPISDLLSPVTRAQQQAMLARLAALSRSSGIPMRLDETNNISCGGQAGVSDSFASALWAVDYVTQAMKTGGLTGINLHSLIRRVNGYSPLVAPTRTALLRGELRAQPEWYALLLAHYLHGDQPLSTRVGAGAHPLSVTALRSTGGRLHLVLVDLEPPGAKPLLVRVRVERRYTRGTILRLTGRTLAASSGVRLGGRAVGADGRWVAPARLPGVSGGAGTLALSVPASSAALVTLYPSA